MEERRPEVSWAMANLKRADPYSSRPSLVDGERGATAAYRRSTSRIEPSRRTRERAQDASVGRWSFIDVDILAGYAAALVVEGPPRVRAVRVWK
jgi:hypothetical protein